MLDELPSLPGVSFCTQVLLYFRVLCPSGAVNILELGRRAGSCELLEGLLPWRLTVVRVVASLMFLLHRACLLSCMLCLEELEAGCLEDSTAYQQNSVLQFSS